MKKILIFLFLSNFFVFNIFSNSKRNIKELVPAGSPIYNYLTLIATENGTVDFTDNAPITIEEIKLILLDYDYDSLSENSKKYYDKILNYFNEQDFSFNSSIFSLAVEPEFNIEGQYKTNESLPWIYDRYKRNSFISVPVSFNINDIVSMKTDIALQQNKGWIGHNDNYLNVPFPVEAMDINFPYYGYISTGIELPQDCLINFRLGLGEQSVGRSVMGSVIHSEYLTGTSYANLEFFSKNLKFNMNITEFNVNKFMYTHGFDVRLFKKLQFSMIESMLAYAPLDLRLFNPWTIYHGQTPWLDYSGEKYLESNTCAYMCFKLAYTPVKNLRLYGLFAQDQFQTPYELENWPNDVTPNAIGFQIGAESFIPLKKGDLHIWSEGYYADPYMYIKEDPNWSLVRSYRENFGDLATFYEWVGCPLGPDTVAGQLNIEYMNLNKWSVGLSYLFKASGEYSGTKVFTPELSWGGHDVTTAREYWVYPNDDFQGFEEAKRRQALKTPSGNVEYTNRIAVNSTYNFNDYISIYSQVGFIYAANFNNEIGRNEFGPEIALSFNFDITRMYWSMK